MHGPIRICLSQRVFTQSASIDVLVVTTYGTQSQMPSTAASHAAMCCAVLCCVLPQEYIEAALLSALDAESEAAIAAHIRSTLTALLAASAPTRPGLWVRLLGAVALAAPPSALAGTQGTTAGATFSVKTLSMLQRNRYDVCS